MTLHSRQRRISLPFAYAQRLRYRFLRRRDGKAAALKFLRENVIAPYRKAWRDPVRYGMYKRALAVGYATAKRIIRAEGA